MTASLLGWLGTATYLTAYMLLTLGFLETGLIYFGMNAVAAGLVMVISAAKASWAAFFINGAWGCISLSHWLRLPLEVPQVVKPISRAGIATALLFAIAQVILRQYSEAFTTLAWCSFGSYIFPYLLFLNCQIQLLEFHGWNFLAAAIIIPRLVIDQNWPVIVIQVFWLGVATVGLLRRQVKSDEVS